MKRWLLFSILCFLIFYSGVRGENKEEWLKLREGRIVVFCHNNDLGSARKYLKITLEKSNYITSITGSNFPDKVTVIIAGCQKEFIDLTGGSIPEWGIGASRPANSLIILKSPSFSGRSKNSEQIITHELSHVLLSHITNHRIIERWFDEGLAQYQSGEGGVNGIVHIARAVLTDNLIPLDKIDYVLAFRREKASLAYAESRASIDFIAREYGSDAIKALLAQLASGRDLNNALIYVLQKNQKEFQAILFKMLKRRYRWAIFLDSRLIISMLFILFFLLAYANVLRKRRKYKDDYEIEMDDEDTSPY